MTRKEQLLALIKEGGTIMATMLSPDDSNYVKWKEKVNTVIRREYGEDSAEYRAITGVDRTVVAVTGNTTNAALLNRAKKRTQDKIAKLEAWAELEDK